MSFRLYKRVNLGAGIHLNISKTGVGLSAGIPGARYSVHSSGRTTRTVGLPGTGLYYRKDSYGKKRATTPRKVSSTARAPLAPAVVTFPKAGLFAPKQDKAFVRGVTAYMQGKHTEALGFFRQVTALDSRQAHVSEEMFAGLCLVAISNYPEAIAALETVIASHQQIPDALMAKYRVAGRLKIQVSPFLEADLPMSSVSAALMLAELYQRQGQSDKAIELLESLGSVTDHPVCALSLAELYSLGGRPDDVIRVSDGFTSNTDDLTAELLTYRAGALSDQGMPDGALAALKEAMRFRSRDRAVLRQARYVRALTNEKIGRKALARKDLERIFAEDPGFADVAARLEVSSDSIPASS
jgi:tetratricopeptide (TPR) repeat protein